MWNALLKKEDCVVTVVQERDLRRAVQNNIWDHRRFYRQFGRFEIRFARGRLSEQSRLPYLHLRGACTTSQVCDLQRGEALYRDVKGSLQELGSGVVVELKGEDHDGDSRNWDWEQHILLGPAVSYIKVGRDGIRLFSHTKFGPFLLPAANVPNYIAPWRGSRLR